MMGMTRRANGFVQYNCVFFLGFLVRDQKLFYSEQGYNSDDLMKH